MPTCLAVSGSVAVVGSPSYDSDPSTGLECGAVKIYDTATGKMLHRLSNPAVEPFGNFGASVAIAGSIVAVGSYNAVEGVRVRCRKPRVVLPGPSGMVEIEIERP